MEMILPDQQIPEILADLVINVSHVNGVFRLTLGQQDAQNQVRPVMRLLIPGSQLSPILQGINKAAGEIMKQIQAQAQERDAAASEPAAEQPDTSDKES